MVEDEEFFCSEQYGFGAALVDCCSIFRCFCAGQVSVVLGVRSRFS